MTLYIHRNLNVQEEKLDATPSVSIGYHRSRQLPQRREPLDFAVHFTN